MSPVGNNRVKVAQRKVGKLPYKHKSLKLAILDKISVYRVNIIFFKQRRTCAPLSTSIFSLDTYVSSCNETDWTGFSLTL